MSETTTEMPDAYKLAVDAYCSGYEAGHHDTVEAVFYGDGKTKTHVDIAKDWLAEDHESAALVAKLDACDAPLPDDVGLSRIAARQITAAVMQVIANAPEGEIPDTVEVALPSLLKRLAPEACLPDDVRAAVERLWSDVKDIDRQPRSSKMLIQDDAFDDLRTILTHLQEKP